MIINHFVKYETENFRRSLDFSLTRSSPYSKIKNTFVEIFKVIECDHKF